MIDITTFQKGIKSHFNKLKSSSFVCSTKSAFESWFTVELIQVLLDLGYTQDQIKRKYTYPGTNNKADLVIDDTIVFELKSFVINESGNKDQEYPKQIKRLEKLLIYKDANQVITFTTYIGYSEEKLLKKIKELFNEDLWEIIGPEKLISKSKHGLYFTVTGIPKDSNSNTLFKNLNNAITQKKMKNEITKTEKKMPKIKVTTKEFEIKLNEIISKAKKDKLISITVKSGNLHNLMNADNRPAMCCNAMKQLMIKEDEILKAPPQGRGTDVLIRYDISARN